jgi:hypothetical protein
MCQARLHYSLVCEYESLLTILLTVILDISKYFAISDCV